MKQETIGWQWHQLDHMQIIYTSLHTDNLSTRFLQARCSSCHPTNTIRALKIFLLYNVICYAGAVSVMRPNMRWEKQRVQHCCQLALMTSLEFCTDQRHRKQDRLMKFFSVLFRLHLVTRFDTIMLHMQLRFF